MLLAPPGFSLLLSNNGKDIPSALIYVQAFKQGLLFNYLSPDYHFLKNEILKFEAKSTQDILQFFSISSRIDSVQMLDFAQALAWTITALFFEASDNLGIASPTTKETANTEKGDFLRQELY